MKTRNHTARWIESASRWQVNVTNDEGKRKTFTSSKAGRAGQTECNRKADAWLRDGGGARSARCDALLEKWLAHVRITTGSANAIKLESTSRNWIAPAIGSMRLDKVTAEDVQGIINAAYAKGLSKKTLHNIRAGLVAFLRYNNITLPIAIPTDAPTVGKQILQPDALRVLLTAPSDEWYIHAWRFQAVTGLRPGELIALTWDCVADGILRVRGAVNSIGERTSGKNKNAIRDEVLPAIALDILKEQRTQTDSLSSPYVFCDRHGHCTNQSTYGKHWARYRAAQGLPDVCLYGLRHTYISVMSARGSLTLAELRATVGHSQNMDTLGVYGHALNGQQQAVAQKANKAFISVLSETQNE